MHEHICHNLIQTEIGSLKIMQTENIIEVDASSTQNEVCQIAYHVNDEQIFRYRWYLSHNYAQNYKKRAIKP